MTKEKKNNNNNRDILTRKRNADKSSRFISFGKTKQQQKAIQVRKKWS